MNFRTLVSFLTIAFFSCQVLAQHTSGGAGAGGGRPSGGVNGANTPTNSTPGLNLPSRLPNPDLSTRPMFLSGKVVVDDGTPLTDAAIIQTICRGNIRDEGYTDSKGAFSVQLGGMAVRQITGAADDTGGRPGGDTVSAGGSTGSS